MNILLIFVCMFLLMFLGMDIFVAMGISATVYLLATGNAPLTLIPQSMINGISSFSLLAIPFFMLTGDFMNISGMTLRLVNFAKFFIGRIKHFHTNREMIHRENNVANFFTLFNQIFIC